MAFFFCPFSERRAWCALCDKALGARVQSRIGFWSSSREVANWGLKVGPIAPKIALPQKNYPNNWRILTKCGICSRPSRSWPNQLFEMSHEIESGSNCSKHTSTRSMIYPKVMLSFHTHVLMLASYFVINDEIRWNTWKFDYEMKAETMTWPLVDVFDYSTCV